MATIKRSFELHKLEPHPAASQWPRWCPQRQSLPSRAPPQLHRQPLARSCGIPAARSHTQQAPPDTRHPWRAVRPSVNVCKSGLFLATLVGKHIAAFLSSTLRTCEHGCRRWTEGALHSPATATISASGQPLQNMYMHFSAAATHLLATRGLMPAALPLLPVRQKCLSGRFTESTPVGLNGFAPGLVSIRGYTALCRGTAHALGVT